MLIFWTFWLEMYNKMLCSETLGRGKYCKTLGKRWVTVIYLQNVLEPERWYIQDGSTPLLCSSLCTCKQSVWHMAVDPVLYECYMSCPCQGVKFSSINVLNWIKLGLCKEKEDSATVSDQESHKETLWTNKRQADISLQTQITTV